MNKKNTNILALIPAYNEAVHVGAVVKKAKAYLPVLVVDDGSTDETAGRAEAAGAAVLSQRPNQGKGAALQAGFRRAVAEGYEAVVMLDGDGQHDPAEISTFLNAYQASQADLIIGARDFSQMPRLRRTTNTIGRVMFSWALGQPIPDNQSGYRLVSRRLMEALVHSKELSWEYEMEMIVVCLRLGFEMEWAPIRTIYADEISHIKPVRHVIHYFRMVWQSRQLMQGKK